MSARYVVGHDWTGTVHAVHPNRVVIGQFVRAACALIATVEYGPTPWPPYAKGPGHFRRCRECWELTGKPRPHPYWAQWRP